MSIHNLSDSEKGFLKVIKNELDYAKKIPSLSRVQETLDENINESEALLRSIGRGSEVDSVELVREKQMPKTLIVRSFDDLLRDANERYPDEIEFEDIFTSKELAANSEYIRQLNAEFNAVYKLDAIDVIIPVVAGILSGSIDCLFGGFVKTASGSNVPGTLSRYVSGLFDKALPAERIQQLEELAKVPYDAMNYNNKGNVIVEKIVEGLSPVFHHNVSLGHDPILGFIFGVMDMLRGTVTTLDFKGELLIQMAEGYSDRKAQNIFQAIATVFLHMLSDVNGASSAKNGGMGLPAPFMALFHKMQFGKIGENDTISELVKSMFYQGYDFRHFCSMSIPVMISEVVVRVSYFVKRLAEGHSFAAAIPVGLSPEKKPKLETMLFIAHSASTAINAGKVLFTQNPLDVNYPQWMSFARYSIKQMKWSLNDKPVLREEYVREAINGEWKVLSASIEKLWDNYGYGAVAVYA